MDLVITELTLPGGNGLDFIGQLKADLQKFENAIHAHCEQLRTEFRGHRAGSVREIAAHAAVV